MSFLSNLMPREDKFHALMRAQSDCAYEAAKLLKDFVGGDNATRKDAGDKIASCRIEGKRLSAQMTRDVALSFITPFDREDIQEFSLQLYKIVKTIDKIRERFDLHGIDGAGGDFAAQADLIVMEAAAMRDIVEALTRKGGEKTIIAKVGDLHDLEMQGDEVLNGLLKKLFGGTTEIRDLLLRKDIYDMMEKVLDRYRDAAAVALQIVLKHS